MLCLGNSLDHTFLESLQQHVIKDTEKEKKETFLTQWTIIRVEIDCGSFPTCHQDSLSAILCVILWYVRDKHTLHFGNAVFIAGQFKCYKQLEVPKLWTSGVCQDALHSREWCTHWLISSLHRVSLVGALIALLPLSMNQEIGEKAAWGPGLPIPSILQ